MNQDASRENRKPLLAHLSTPVSQTGTPVSSHLCLLHNRISPPLSRLRVTVFIFRPISISPWLPARYCRRNLIGPAGFQLAPLQHGQGHMADRWLPKPVHSAGLWGLAILRKEVSSGGHTRDTHSREPTRPTGSVIQAFLKAHFIPPGLH